MGSIFGFILGLFIGAVFSKPLYMLFGWIVKKISEFMKKE